MKTLKHGIYQSLLNKSDMKDERSGYIQLVLYSILAGVVGVFIKLTQNLDAQSLVFFRAAIATATIFAIVLFRNKLKDLLLITPAKTVMVGIFQGLSIFLYINSLLHTTVSNAVFLLYTAPIFSVILAKLFLKEKIEKETLIGVFITLIGIILILDPRTFSFDSTQTLGNVIALGSGFFYAAMALTAKPIMKKVSGFYMAFWQYLVISIMFLLFVNVKSASVLLDNWWQLAIIGIICTGIPFILFMEGVRKVKAQKIFIVTALEPLAGTALALFALGEIPSLFTIAGALLILYGVYRTTQNKE
ncbi:MAG: EamA family transporter [Candidatus Micrarchaeota archaeon]|nr:EamA family transporter [Candidatus Micrarchaeota archaeon]